MAIDPVTAGLEILQAGFGLAQASAGQKKANKYISELTPYKTPTEVTDVLNATKANAAEGYDATSLNYLTSQINQSFAASNATALRLGIDHNGAAANFRDNVSAIMKVGSDNHILNMENFSRYLAALGVLSDNKAAEWKSRQDILKDKIQTAVGDKQAGVQNVGNAVNSFIGSENYAKLAKLYGITPTTDTSGLNTTTKAIAGELPSTLPDLSLTGGSLAGAAGDTATNLPTDMFFRKY